MFKSTLSCYVLRLNTAGLLCSKYMIMLCAGIEYSWVTIIKKYIIMCAEIEYSLVIKFKGTLSCCVLSLNTPGLLCSKYIIMLCAGIEYS